MLIYTFMSSSLNEEWCHALPSLPDRTASQPVMVLAPLMHAGPPQALPPLLTSDDGLCTQSCQHTHQGPACSCHPLALGGELGDLLGEKRRSHCGLGSRAKGGWKA